MYLRPERRTKQATPSPEEWLLKALYELFIVSKADGWRAVWPFALTPTQLAILRLMRERRRPLDITTIASELGCSHPTVSRAVAALERKTWVSIERDPYDGRRTLVRPVAAGWEDDPWDPGYGEAIGRRIEALDDRELRTVVDAIEILSRVPPVDTTARDW